MERLILYLIGRSLMICAGLMLIPFIYSIESNDVFYTGIFGQSIFFTLFVSVLLCHQPINRDSSLSTFGGAVFLFAIWPTVALFGCLPYFLSGQLGFIDSFMEGVSGFTTTGYTHMITLKDPPLILWRSLTQWIGGGMILIFIATILPAVNGIFGMNFALPFAVKTGIVSLMRIRKNFLRISLLYASFSGMCVFFFFISGLNLYDAVNFAMITLSTGGCYFSEVYRHNNIWFAFALILALVTAGCNVAIYWYAFNRRKSSILKENLKNTESHIFLLIILGIGTLIGIHLYGQNIYSLSESLLYGFFSVALYAGTTGAFPVEILKWTDFDKLLLILAACVGGCIGSLAGGFKILRLMILFKSCVNELTRTIHPNIITTIKIDEKIVSPALINRVLGFFFIVILTVLLSITIISAAGLNMQQAFDIALACITSTGTIMLFHADPAVILSLPSVIKLFCSFLMILGKVDYFALLILLFGGQQHLLNKHW